MGNPFTPPEPGSAPQRHRVLLLIALSLLLITGSIFLTSSDNSGTIVVTFPNGYKLTTEVADTPNKIYFGLAFRDHLPEDSGMLYIFDTSDKHQLHTKEFQFTVDMMWADESRFVVHLVEYAEPCIKDPCPFYGPPPKKARYVIQAAGGFIRREEVTTGMELKFTLKM